MRGWLRGGWKDWLWLMAAAVLFFAALLTPLSTAFASDLTAEEQQLLEAYKKGEIIRLHVVAHSDSACDQAVKLAVRDAILDVFGAAMASAADESYQSACDFLSENLGLFEEVARKRAAELGFSGSVSAETGMLELPEKTYGNVTLPHGHYRALRITLGSGKGQNWWCILFPQLCLSIAQNDENSTSFAPVWHSRHIFSNWLLHP